MFVCFDLTSVWLDFEFVNLDYFGLVGFVAFVVFLFFGWVDDLRCVTDLADLAFTVLGCLGFWRFVVWICCCCFGLWFCCFGLVLSVRVCGICLLV